MMLRWLGGVVLALLIPAAAAAQGFGSPSDNPVGEVRGALGDAADAGQQVGNAVETAMESHDALGDLDRQLDDALDDPEPDVPPVPSSCIDRPACEECFFRAYEQLARSRVLLLRAQALFTATHRFATSSQAHGDNLAPMSKEAALYWMAQKQRIAVSLTQFDAVYDKKIEAMLAVVERTLRELGVCEKNFYDTLDWYQRYGFIYFEFLQSRYRRS